MCICDRVTLHTEWKSICCCENSESCHNVMCNTNQEFQHFVNKTGCNWDSIQNYCFLGLCRTSHTWTNGSKISVQPHIFIMHAVISDTYMHNKSIGCTEIILKDPGQIVGTRASLNGQKKKNGAKNYLSLRHFYRLFRLSLAPTICPWVFEDILTTTTTPFI